MTYASLAHPLTDAIRPANPEWRLAFTEATLPVDDRLTGRFTLAEFPSHTSTHIDGPLHVHPNARGLHSFPTEFFCGPGIVLDLPLGPGDTVSAATLESAEPEIRPGDIVFIAFGYAKHFGTHEYHDHPWLSVDAAQWLVRRGVKILGLDTPTPDMPAKYREPGFNFPVHDILLGNEILIIENLGGAIADFAGSRVEVVMAPVLMGRGDGGPIVPLVRRA